jgi:hypothetical protein
MVGEGTGLYFSHVRIYVSSTCCASAEQIWISAGDERGGRPRLHRSLEARSPKAEDLYHRTAAEKSPLKGPPKPPPRSPHKRPAFLCAVADSIIHSLLLQYIFFVEHGSLLKRLYRTPPQGGLNWPRPLQIAERYIPRLDP